MTIGVDGESGPPPTGGDDSGAFGWGQSWPEPITNDAVSASGWGDAPAAPPSPRPRRRTPGWAGITALVVVAALIGVGASVTVARLTGWGRETLIRQVVPTSLIKERPASIPSILARVLPSVVSITATSTQSSPDFGPDGGSATVTSVGTGIVITKSGEVITNDHVVSGARSVTLKLQGVSKSLKARLVGASASHDLALLQIQAAPSDLTPARLGDSQTVVVGDEVLAIGYALGLSGGPSVTDGIISAMGRSVSTESAEGATETLRHMLQTDAAISSGNSGGPLVNSSAQVIGINTVVATTSSSATAQNIGFAIPSQTLKSLLPQLRAGRS